MLQRQSRWQDALEAFDEAREIAAPALEAVPPDEMGRMAWAAAESNRAQLLRLAAEYDEARAGFERALPVFRAQLDAAPCNAHALDIYGLALSGAAQVEWAAGPRERAFELWRQALELLERARARPRRAGLRRRRRHDVVALRTRAGERGPARARRAGARDGARGALRTRAAPCGVPRLSPTAAAGAGLERLAVAQARTPGRGQERFGLGRSALEARRKAVELGVDGLEDLERDEAWSALRVRAEFTQLIEAARARKG